MKISTKGRYALRLMLDLAMNGENNVVRIKDIAERQQISDKYLGADHIRIEQGRLCAEQLRTAGRLFAAESTEEYTVGDILRLTEGSLAPVACVEEEGSCEREVDCVTVEVWKRLNQAISDVVDHITLADLVALQEEKREKSGLDFGKDI